RTKSSQENSELVPPDSKAKKNPEKGKNAVYKYNIYLRGPMVDTTVELIEQQDKMNKIKNQLKESMKHSSDDKIESCLELLEELEFIHREDVQLAIDLLSIENEKHKEMDVAWLKNELEKASNIISKVLEWIESCKATMKSKEY
ncbi:13597_t:CDS:2, partial [Dentiscutata heterogama]